MAAVVVRAPERPELPTAPRIFLAGTTTATKDGDWRERIISRLSEYTVVLLNPKRDDWDCTWREHASDPRWREQIEWELDMQEAASIIAFVFLPETPAPISMLELGMHVASGKRDTMVFSHPDFVKSAYVEAVCKRHGSFFCKSENELLEALRARCVDV